MLSIVSLYFALLSVSKNDKIYLKVVLDYYLMHKENPELQKKIAKERIDILFKEAGSIAKEEPALAKRYMKLAKKIGMRYNIRLGKLKRRFCKHCYAYFLPGVNCSQRLKNKKITIKCFTCNKTIRYPYKK